MKATATHKLTRLAATAGFMGWSDETLKQQIAPVAKPLDRIVQL